MRDILSTAAVFTGFAGFMAFIAGAALACWMIVAPAANYVVSNVISLDAVIRISG